MHTFMPTEESMDQSVMGLQNTIELKAFMAIGSEHLQAFMCDLGAYHRSKQMEEKNKECVLIML